MADRESEIREKLESALNQPLWETVWNKLAEDGWVEDYDKRRVVWEDFRDQAVTEIGYAEKLRGELLNGLGGEARPARGQRVQASSSEEKPENFRVSFTSWESARATAHTLHVAELANRNLHVQAFREEVLGKAYPLDAFWAQELVRSPAAAFFPLEWFQSWGVSVVGHLSEIEGEYVDNRFSREEDHRVTVQFDSHTVRSLPERSWLLLKGGRVRARYALGAPPSTDKIDVQRVKQHNTSMGTDAVPPKPDFILGLDERPRPDYVWPGSVLAELKALSKKLDRLYWQTEGGEISAAWFVLTGIPTLVLPLEVETKVEPRRRYVGESQSDWFTEERVSEASIRLTVQPWIHADRVRDIYRDAQKRIMGSAKQPWTQSLEAYIFVKESGLEDRKGEPEPFELYNEQAPKEKSYKKPHGFWQAYENAREKVENFHYRKPGR